jgi:hypothetical protein
MKLAVFGCGAQRNGAVQICNQEVADKPMAHK